MNTRPDAWEIPSYHVALHMARAIRYRRVCRWRWLRDLFSFKRRRRVGT